MYAIAKHNCFNSGIAEVGDCVEANKPSQYVIKLTGSLPKCNIETRGIDHSLVCAHSLPFPKQKPETSCDDFIMLYRGSDNLNPAFWSVEVSKGEKAVLKTLSIEAAAKLYDELPQRLSDKNYLFAPGVFKRQQEQLQKSNSDFKESEKQRIKDAERAKEGPMTRMMRDGLS